MRRIRIALIAGIMAFLCSPAEAKRITEVILVQDLLLLVPQFDNAPDFRMEPGISGRYPLGDPGKAPRMDKAREAALLDLVRDVLDLPESTVMRIHRGNLVISYDDKL